MESPIIGINCILLASVGLCTEIINMGKGHSKGYPSVIAVAVINIMTKNNLGRKGFIWFT